MMKMLQKVFSKAFVYKTYLKKLFLALLVFWTISNVLLLVFLYQNSKTSIWKAAVNECKTDFNKDVQYRIWATQHGGVYVPQTEKTPPNPYLAHIPERDIITPSGKKLTLVNPAYMTRQVYELGKERFNFLGHITSLNPIRKENKADDWERKTLLEFEKGEKEKAELAQLNGKTYIRYMSVFKTEKGCLKCHAQQGYKEGDIRGGISISLLWQPYKQMLKEDTTSHFIYTFFIWLLGVAGLYFSYLKVKAHNLEKEKFYNELKENEKLLNTLLNGLNESALLIDKDGFILAANETVDKRINGGKKDLVGKNIFEVIPKDVANLRREKLRIAIQNKTSLFFEDIRMGQNIENYISPILNQEGIVTKLALIGIDISDRKRSEATLRMLAREFSHLSGKEFYESISEHMCKVLGLDFVFVGKLNREMHSVNVLGGFAMGSKMDLFSYDLVDTPCDNVMGNSTCIYPANIQALFPKDHLLVQMGIESYVGSPIFDKNQQPLGILVGLHSKKLDKPNVVEELFNVFLERISAEIQRSSAEAELENHKNNLEYLVEERTEEIDAINKQLIHEMALKDEAEKQLHAALEKEKELNALKSRFISTASHEFRTPLTTVLTSSELIQRFQGKWGEEKVNEHLVRIKNSVEYLTKLLDDVLTVNKSEVGKIEFLPSSVNLKDLCNQVINDLNVHYFEELSFEFGFNSKRENFTLDKKLVESILHNLLSNAIKYSLNKGEVKLIVEFNEKTLSVAVSDKGIGIPEEDLQYLFEPFHRSKNTAHIKGTGLGLTIVKNAVELHGGTVSVSSKINEGTCFRIEIPVGD